MKKKITRQILTRYTSLAYKPGLVFTLYYLAWKASKILSWSQISFPYARFIRTNRVPTEYLDIPQVFPDLEIVIVAAEKDFEILPITLEAASQNVLCSNNSIFTIVVPDHSIIVCQEIVNKLNINYRILPEGKVLGENIVSELKNIFGQKYGWVLQQILKFQLALETKYPGVLLIDSDTILLKKRLWAASNGQQILMPTYEIHKPYYDFLSKIGIIRKRPKFSFVSHHMYFDKSIVREIASFLNWRDVKHILESVKAEVEAESPFSIDYELYGQYLFLNHKEKVMLTKWANLSVARETLLSKNLNELQLEFDDFESLSGHSYLEMKAATLNFNKHS